jgi:hypothetical protein
MSLSYLERWIAVAVGANLVLTAIVLVALGADNHGTETALRITARVSFLWFWAAYAGGALTTLFGRAFLPLKQYGRELGLAFAAALLVHLSLVAWLCWIGAAPAVGVFVFFGTAAGFTYLLALCSFGDLHSMLGQRWWQLLRIVGMNFILYAFFKDFTQGGLLGGFWHAVAYVPFVVMAIAAPLLRIAAGVYRVWGSAKGLPTRRRPQYIPADADLSDVTKYRKSGG